MREVVCQNQRAAETLRDARARTPWLAVTLEKFGRHKLSPAKGLLTIGDAASFIDPFTGSGMLMALESGELAANVICDHLSESASKDFDKLSANYRAAYEQSFDSRLRVCSLMRRAAFTPGIAAIAIRLFGLSDHVRHFIARGTRRPSKPHVASLD
jgi:flavin-dependent dehydrogenase